jgi:hypothetical protein
MNAEKRARAIARRRIMEKRGLMRAMKKALVNINRVNLNYQKEMIRSNFVVYAKAMFSLEGPHGEDLIPFRTSKAWEKLYQAYRNYLNTKRSSNNMTTSISPSHMMVARRLNGRYFVVNNPS